MLGNNVKGKAKDNAEDGATVGFEVGWKVPYAPVRKLFGFMQIKTLWEI